MRARERKNPRKKVPMTGKIKRRSPEERRRAKEILKEEMRKGKGIYM